MIPIRNVVAACCMLIAYIGNGETIVIKGSDTLGAKLLPLLAESFRASHSERYKQLSFEIAAEGSSTGIASIIEGATDIGMSSREVAPIEFLQAEANHRDIRQIPVARDCLAVVVHPSNPISNLTRKEIEHLFCGDIQNWAGLSLKSGATSVYVRSSASGTYSAFRELALSGRDYGQNSLSMAGNEQIAEEIANNHNAIGYVGLAYANRFGLKILSVDGLSPNHSDYPLTRPLYFLIDHNHFDNPIARDFVNFVLSEEGQEIVESVYFIPVEGQSKLL